MDRRLDILNIVESKYQALMNEYTYEVNFHLESRNPEAIELFIKSIASPAATPQCQGSV